MKKLLAVVAVLVLICLLCGCGQASETDGTQSVSVTEESETTGEITEETYPDFSVKVVGSSWEVDFSFDGNHLFRTYSSKDKTETEDFALDAAQKEQIRSFVSKIGESAVNAEYENPDFAAFKVSYNFTKISYLIGERSYTTYFDFTENEAVKESILFFNGFLPESYTVSPDLLDNSKHSEEHLEVMGFEATAYRREFYPGWYFNTYVAKDDNVEPFICGESYGFPESPFDVGVYAPYNYALNTDYAVDLDGDGITELVCNCTSGGDGRPSVEVFKYDSGVVRSYNITYQELDLEGRYNYGNGSEFSFYDPETNAIHVIYWRVEEGKEVRDGEYCDITIGLSDMVEVDS